ncbi:MAG: GTPase Era [Acidobacteria bacterium]|nr:MAG: GTPase Era [Acidobacteriota bacterium]
MSSAEETSGRSRSGGEGEEASRGEARRPAPSGTSRPDDPSGQAGAADVAGEDTDFTGGESLERGRVALQGLELLADDDLAQGLASWLDRLIDELAPEGDSLAVQLTDDPGMEELSETFRGRRASTDVLSFPGEKTPEGLHLGDVVICVPYAARQAEERGHGLDVEMQVLLLHGLLHCLGYDHESDSGEMERLEADLRARHVVADLARRSQPGQAPRGIPGDNEGDGAATARRTGRVALIGRPNAGKSTLMNRFLGEKLAIVSDKPQTTRQRLLGLLTTPRGQMIFLDTPGVHKPEHRLNRRMVKAATDALGEADVICLVVDASVRWGKGDEYLLELLRRVDRPKIAALNKVDAMRKSKLLELIDRLRREQGFEEFVPISALEGEATETLLELLWERLPVGPPEYAEDLLTTQSERFLVAERIREKILDQTRDELPFATAVSIDDWRDDEESDRLILQATIWVERPGQKKIIIGKGGQMIKQIGTAARLDLEEFLGRRVFLDLFVRQVDNWREDPRRLADLDRQNAFDLPS